MAGVLGGGEEGDGRCQALMFVLFISKDGNSFRQQTPKIRALKQ